MVPVMMMYILLLKGTVAVLAPVPEASFWRDAKCDFAHLPSLHSVHSRQLCSLGFISASLVVQLIYKSMNFSRLKKQLSVSENRLIFLELHTLVIGIQIFSWQLYYDFCGSEVCLVCSFEIIQDVNFISCHSTHYRDILVIEVVITNEIAKRKRITIFSNIHFSLSIPCFNTKLFWYGRTYCFRV